MFKIWGKASRATKEGLAGQIWPASHDMAIPDIVNAAPPIAAESAGDGLWFPTARA